MLSIAVTFSLLAFSTLSRLRSVLLDEDLDCDRKSADEIDVPEDKLVLLSIATMAEVP